MADLATTSTQNQLRLLFINKVSPEAGGGAELRLKQLTTHLSKNGHHILIICGKTNPDEPSGFQMDGCTVTIIPTLPRLLFRWKISFYLSRLCFYFTSAFLLWRLIAKKHWDYVIDDYSPLPSLAIILARLYGVPYIATIHEVPTPRWLRTRGILAGLGGAFTLATLKIFQNTQAIAVSTDTATRLTKLGLNNVSLVPNGISIPRPLPSQSAGSGRLVMLGRLVPQKGHLIALHAFKKALAQNKNLSLTVIGDGPYRPRIESEIKKLDLTETVQLRGQVDENTKWLTLRSSDLFLFPSLEEGFGIALLEAMAAGLPVVCSNLPAFQGLFKDGENGFSVPPNDYRLLSEALLALISDAQSYA